MVKETELQAYFCSFNIISYFFYADLISSLLDAKVVDPRSNLIYVGEYDVVPQKWFRWYHSRLRSLPVTYAAFTLNGFDDQAQNLMFVKTDFQISKT